MIALLGLTAFFVVVFAVLALDPSTAPMDMDGGVGEPIELFAPQTLYARFLSANHSCAGCHPSWTNIVRVTGTAVTQDARTTYAFDVAPSTSYNLTDIRVADTRSSEEASLVVATNEFTTNVAPTGPTTGILRVSEGAGSVYMRVVPYPESGAHRLHLTLRGQSGTVESTEARSVAVTLAPRFGLIPGDYTWELDVVSGTVPLRQVRVFTEIAPADARALPVATGDAPASFRVVTDESTRGVLLLVRPYNHHPVASWTFNARDDYAEYRYWVSTDPPLSRWNWTRDRAETTWNGEARIEIEDKVWRSSTVVAHDSAGNWATRSYAGGTGGRAARAIPPGAARLEVDLSWTPSNPSSADVEWFFTYQIGVAEPLFYSPVASGSRADFRHYVVELDPCHWDYTPERRSFEGFALIDDSGGPRTFQGEVRLVVNAVRGPPDFFTDAVVTGPPPDGNCRGSVESSEGGGAQRPLYLWARLL